MAQQILQNVPNADVLQILQTLQLIQKHGQIRTPLRQSQTNKALFKDKAILCAGPISPRTFGADPGLKPYAYDLYEMIPGFLAGVGATVIVSLLTQPDAQAMADFDDIARTAR